MTDNRTRLIDADGHSLGIYRTHDEAIEALGRRPDAIGGSVAICAMVPATYPTEGAPAGIIVEPMTDEQAYAFAVTMVRNFTTHDTARMRFTYPNGYQRSGEASVVQPPRDPRWKPDAADADPQVHLDGRYVGGELCGFVRVEVMQANGRYRTCWEE